MGLAIDAHKQRLEIEHDNAAWAMWHGAVLTRIESIPPLTDFLSGKKKQVSRVDERAIMARLKAYSARYGKENGDSSKP